MERSLSGPMRAILWIGGGFVLVAGIQLFAFSDRTDEYFAWTIASEQSAAFLGAFYLMAAAIALGSARKETWARARLGMPGVIAFVWLTLLATLLHLGLFHLDDGPATARAAAWVWLAIYVIEPPVLALVFWLQLRAPGGNPERDARLPDALRGLLVAQACVLGALGVLLFAAPLDTAAVWPWELTELTARAIGAWLVALAGLLGAVAWENERSRIRLGAWPLVALVALQALALARFSDELDFSAGSAWIYAVALAGLGATGIWGWRVSTG